jgi:hypothetical protein
VGQSKVCSASGWPQGNFLYMLDKTCFSAAAVSLDYDWMWL